VIVSGRLAAIARHPAPWVADRREIGMDIEDLEWVMGRGVGERPGWPLTKAS
jgi:hypothetical protein